MRLALFALLAASALALAPVAGAASVAFTAKFESPVRINASFNAHLTAAESDALRDQLDKAGSGNGYVDSREYGTFADKVRSQVKATPATLTIEGATPTRSDYGVIGWGLVGAVKGGPAGFSYLAYFGANDVSTKLSRYKVAGEFPPNPMLPGLEITMRASAPPGHRFVDAIGFSSATACEIKAPSGATGGWSFAIEAIPDPNPDDDRVPSCLDEPAPPPPPKKTGWVMNKKAKKYLPGAEWCANLDSEKDFKGCLKTVYKKSLGKCEKKSTKGGAHKCTKFVRKTYAQILSLNLEKK